MRQRVKNFWSLLGKVLATCFGMIALVGSAIYGMAHASFPQVMGFLSVVLVVCVVAICWHATED